MPQVFSLSFLVLSSIKLFPSYLNFSMNINSGKKYVILKHFTVLTIDQTLHNQISLLLHLLHSGCPRAGKYYQIKQEVMGIKMMLQIKFLISTKATVNHVRKGYRWLHRGGPISVGSLRMTYF